MSQIVFPQNPTNGQEFKAPNGATYQYDSATGQWTVLFAPGITGPTGATGADSTVPGATGETGEQGATGVDGTPSTIPGATGATGPDGPVGSSGATGATSVIPGSTGATGEQGATGPATGVLNFKGDGPTGTYPGILSSTYPSAVAGDTYRNPADASYWAYNGTSWNNLGVLLKGEDGGSGATGATGTPGTLGPTGATGDPGPTGSPSSVPGATGATGPAGPAGGNGSPGGQGPPGNNGNNGGPGPGGPPGPPGPGSSASVGLSCGNNSNTIVRTGGGGSNSNATVKMAASTRMSINGINSNELRFATNASFYYSNTNTRTTSNVVGIASTAVDNFLDNANPVSFTLSDKAIPTSFPTAFTNYISNLGGGIIADIDIYSEWVKDHNIAVRANPGIGSAIIDFDIDDYKFLGNVGLSTIPNTFGFLAEELVGINTAFVTPGVKAVVPETIIPFLVKALQIQRDQIDNLQARVTALETP